jgi:F0F1-type ATP synthase membrane subunit b/b'
LSETKLKEYKKILDDAKKEVIKIQIESKNILDKDIKIKKEAIEKEIESEILKAQKEISELKKGSISDIQKISEDIASDIIETISGDKLNESSIKAVVEDLTKKNTGKYL